MTQIDQAWGAGPSDHYEELAERFRPIFRRIRENAISRDNGRILPHEEVQWLKEAGFSALRVPVDNGGFGVSLPDFFNLLIELSEADPNITNVFRSHFGFTEDLLNSRFSGRRSLWLSRFADQQLIGSGFSETGDTNVGVYTTRLVRNGNNWLLNGKKYYTSGALFADWINLGAVDENDKPIGGLIPTRAPGVSIIDDWDGFGQALSASGTAVFTNVDIDNELIHPEPGRCRYVGAFFQHVHLATLAGVGRAAANDVARLVAERRRVYGHGNADRAGDDPQILQVIGRVRGAAYSAGAIVLKVAEALQRVYDAHIAGDTEAENKAGAIADLEVNQAVTVVTSLILDATTVLFDALGASAVKKSHGLDRHWRNARTIASHNPRIYRDRIVGNFAVNGVLPAARLPGGAASRES